MRPLTSLPHKFYHCPLEEEKPYSCMQKRQIKNKFDKNQTLEKSNKYFINKEVWYISLDTYYIFIANEMKYVCNFTIHCNNLTLHTTSILLWKVP